MKDIREQILKILTKIKNVLIEDELIGSDYPGLTHKFHTERIGDNEVASDIESLIKENYVDKAFVEWYKNQDVFTMCMINDQKRWFIPYNYTTQTIYLTFDELYDYWKQHISEK